MTDLDHQVATLLRSRAADLDDALGWDPDAVAHGGLALGRRRRRRRRVGTSLAALALVVVAGVGVAVGVGDDTRRAIDPPVADTTATATPTVTPTVTPGVPGATADSPATASPATAPRALAFRAARLPDVLASLLPGEVSVVPAKTGEQNPQDGFDSRFRFDDQPDPTFEGEPGPGIFADLVWNGQPLRVSVTPSEPSFGDTPMQRCLGNSEGDNGRCVATPDGGVLQETTYTSPDDGLVRAVSRYTPDLWEVFVMATGTQPDPTLAQLETVVDSDVWFR